MPSHDQSNQIGQSACDRLLSLLSEDIPGLRREKKDNSCGFFVTGANRFAYVYHKKSTSELRIYFRGDSLVVPSAGAPSTVHSRSKFSNSWDLTFPHFLDIDDRHKLKAVADFLRHNAYPLSKQSRRSKKEGGKEFRQINTIEEVSTSIELREGVTRSVLVNVFERNRTARLLCIEAYGCSCWICKFDFQRVYGEIGIDYIQVHHIRPLASIGREYVIDPVADLRPVCANCHAMIHRTDPPLECDSVLALIQQGPYRFNNSGRTMLGTSID